jgi:hypothetical protein
MIARCHNQNHRHFAFYGGRGVQVCQRWRSGFINFLEDMGQRPDGMSIDRIDNDKGYDPTNCQWATMSTQSNNRRSSRRVRFRGTTKTVKQWCEELHLNEELIRSRLKLGWNFAKAVGSSVLPSTRDRVDVTGQRFGNLVAIEYSRTENKRAMWLCRCDCGATKVVAGKYLRTGGTKSCGCQRGRPGQPKPRKS